MMFRSKKKLDFPDKPSPPTLNQMEQDLKQADKNDIVFTYFTKSQDEDCDINHVMSTLKEKDMLSDKSRSSLFLCATKCVEMNQQLNNEVTDMNNTSGRLNILCDDLSENVDKVKSQALGALSKS